MPKCLDSIIHQTYKQLEIILIDDGSPDKCGQICDAYKSIDNRIIVIHQQNRGVSAARNAGLKIASGEYIGFIDPDDWIAPDMYEKLIAALINHHADISCCAVKQVDENRNEYSKGDDLIPKVMDQTSFIRQILTPPHYVYQSVWNKLYKRSLITCNFDEHARICEDALFLIQYCGNIKKATFEDSTHYFVFQRPGSAIRSDKQNSVNALPIHKKIIDIAKNISPVARDLAEADYLDCCLQYLNYPDAKCYFQSYIQKNRMMILANREIRWKLKVLLFLKYKEKRI